MTGSWKPFHGALAPPASIKVNLEPWIEMRGCIPGPRSATAARLTPRFFAKMLGTEVFMMFAPCWLLFDVEDCSLRQQMLPGQWAAGTAGYISFPSYLHAPRGKCPA